MIDLLVVNYNTKPLLERLLNVLRDDDDGCSWKLYIADNGSTDGSRDFLQRAANEYRIEYIEYGDNVGYAKAINSLATKGDSEFLAALNADAWLRTVDIRKIEEHFASYPQAAVIGPKQRDENGRIRHAGIFWVNETFRHRDWATPDSADLLHRDKIEECGTVSGSAYFVRRKVWDEMTNCSVYQKTFPGVEGAMLPTPLYFEETGLSRHVVAHGYQVLYDGLVSIGHTWAASTPEGNTANAQLVPISREAYVTFCRAHNIPVERNLM